MPKQRALGQVSPAGSSYLVAQQCQAHTGISLVLTPNNSVAMKLQEELAFYLPDTWIERFPDRETLPYDQFSPHQDITSERLRLLSQLPTKTSGVLLASIETLMHRLPPPSFLASEVLCLSPGDTFQPLAQAELLERAGYARVNQVLSRGEFAIRGSIVDLYPMGLKDPIRIELFDDEVLTLRYFDPETQRSREEIPSLQVLPAAEYPVDARAVDGFIQAWQARFQPNTFKSPLLDALKHQRTFGGTEYYLPLFFNETAYLLDYLPSATQVVHLFDTYPQAERFWGDIEDRYAFCQHDLNRPALKPLDAFFHPTQVFSRLKQFDELKLVEKSLSPSPHQANVNIRPLPSLDFDPHHDNPLHRLRAFLSTNPGKVLISAESPGRRELLLEHLLRAEIAVKATPDFRHFLADPSPIQLTISPIEDSFWLTDASFLLLTENALFHQFTPQSRLRKTKTPDIAQSQLIRDLSELKPQDAVVHVEYGVGRYLGLQTLSVGEHTNECLVIEYLDGDKLFVPIQNLHLITRYSGCEMQFAPISRLGTDRWQKDKEKAFKRVHDVAAELLEVYAKREAKPGFSFKKPDEEFAKFCAEFPFEETADQLSAIAAVIDDMHAPTPMDRLLCGDVGFGKTEVAMRAAFLAISQNKQVAVLVPTTLLAQQHYDSFTDRFANWPVSIEMLSRFKTPEQQKQILKKIETGHVHILIGTHKLLNPDVKFQDLGLLVVDEEHRFGVKHKERIKAMRTEVDIMTLTATPIPRTLNLAFSSLRDLSLMATPPAKRLSVRTFVKELSSATVKEAISREVHRGGQVFYLYNDVSRIEARREELQQLFPDLRIGVGHGQMRERDLETVMAAFYHNHYHVLLCSTIIETGIDIPNANTIIIERADRFGLAQLHQLRGRVGRSHHQAYAYRHPPPWDALTEDAKKRLDVIQEASHLGAGFTLASHDLEIRGAGELLGDDQSGHIEHIGFSLYLELLEKTVNALKTGKKLNLTEAFEAEHLDIDLGLTAIIPQTYVEDVSTRLALYKRIADASEPEGVDQLKSELIDRFGPLPTETQQLLSNAQLRLRAKPLGIRQIKASSTYITVEFKSDSAAVPGDKIIRLLQTQPNLYKLKGPQAFMISLAALKAPEERVVIVGETLRKLTGQRGGDQSPYTSLT